MMLCYYRILLNSHITHYCVVEFEKMFFVYYLFSCKYLFVLLYTNNVNVVTLFLSPNITR